MRRRASRTSLHRRGVTLLELIVASGVAAILLASLGSVVMLASRAVPRDAAAAGAGAATFAADLRAELEAAEGIVAWSDRALVLTVPDGDADGRPERIQYAWSGTPGAPLRRSFDGTPAADLLPGVESLVLSMRRSVRTERFPGPAVEDVSARQLAAFLAGDAGGVQVDAELALDAASLEVRVLEVDLGLGGEDPDPAIPERTLTTTARAGQAIAPRLPPDAIAWRPTRIDVALVREALAVDRIVGELRPSVGGRPGTEVLASATIDPGVVVDRTGWWSLVFAAAPAIPAGEEVILVLRGDRADESGASKVRWDADPATSGRLKSEDGGSTWTRHGGQALEHRVFGRVLRETGVRTIHHVAADALDLRLETDSGSLVETTIDLPARPALASGRWALALPDDPTARDDDADGAPDWTIRGGGSWTDALNRVVDAAPAHPLDDPFVLEVSARATGSGASLMVAAEAASDAGGSSPVRLLVVRVGDEHRATVQASRGGVLRDLLVVRGLPAARPVTARLAVHPGAGGVHVVLDGRDYGTWPLERRDTPPAHRGVSVIVSNRLAMEADVVAVVPEALP